MYPSDVNDFVRQQMNAQSYANRFAGQNKNVALVDPDHWVETTREAIAADLGIIDQNLDDKIGAVSGLVPVGYTDAYYEHKRLPHVADCDCFGCRSDRHYEAITGFKFGGGRVVSDAPYSFWLGADV